LLVVVSVVVVSLALFPGILSTGLLPEDHSTKTGRYFNFTWLNTVEDCSTKTTARTKGEIPISVDRTQKKIVSHPLRIRTSVENDDTSDEIDRSMENLRHLANRIDQQFFPTDRWHHVPIFLSSTRHFVITSRINEYVYSTMNEFISFLVDANRPQSPQ
jgi:hypothetical protein